MIDRTCDTEVCCLSSKKSTALNKIALNRVKVATGSQKPTQKKNLARMVLERLRGMKGKGKGGEAF